MTEGSLYEFKIAAVNLAGIGQPSDPSELFKCEAWTMPEPGKRPLLDCRVALCGVSLVSAGPRSLTPRTSRRFICMC